MKVWLQVVACLLAFTAGGGCVDEPIPPEAVPLSEPGPAPDLDASKSSTVAKLIGPGGGVITLDDGFVLRIPRHALEADVRVTVTPLDLEGGAIGPRYRLGPEGQSFLTSVSITVPFDPQVAAARGAGLPVYVFAASNPTAAVVSLGGTLVDPAHVRSDATTFAVFGAGIAER